MKRVLSLLTAVTLTASTTTSVISCSSNNGPSIKTTSQDINKALEGKKVNIDNKYKDTKANDTETTKAIKNKIENAGFINKDDIQYISFENKILRAGDNYISVTATKNGATATQPQIQSQQLNVYISNPVKPTTSQDIIKALEGKKVNIDNKYLNTRINSSGTKNAVKDWITSLGYVSSNDIVYVSFPDVTLNIGDNYIAVSANKNGKLATQPSDKTKQLDIFVKQPNKNQLVGYWYGWNSSIKTSKKIPLADVTKYDIINVAFMVATSDHKTLTYTPDNEQIVMDGIKKQHELGHKVLLSIGGATTDAMSLEDEAKNQSVMDSVLNKYKFDGIDIDLEGLDVMQNKNNITILGDILKKEKAKNPNFLIGMAPQFPNLRISSPSGSYKGLVDSIGMNNIDYFWPQLYNQGGDGINVDSSWFGMLDTPKWWITNAASNDKEKALFLAGVIYYMYHPGKNSAEKYIKIPTGKLFFGLATDPTATYNHATYSTEAQLALAMQDLNTLGVKISGWMTWAINFDAYFNWRFAGWYNKLV